MNPIYTDRKGQFIHMDNKTDCTNRAAVVADELLSIGAVFLSPDKPFTWASGIKSPIYCDNRLTLTAPDVRNKH